MPAKIKINLIAWLIILALGLGAIIGVARFIGLTARPVVTQPRVAMQTQARSLAVVAIIPNGYKARDLQSKVETIVITPASAAVGDILAVKKYVVAANGLIATVLDVLPPVPTAKPPKNSTKPTQ